MIRMWNKRINLDEYVKVTLRGTIEDGPKILEEIFMELPRDGIAEIELIIKTEKK